MKKICSRCKVEKPKTDFAKRSDTASGVQSICKVCKSAQHQERKEKNDAYRASNRHRLVKGSRDYYGANRERLLLQKKEYYLENRSAILGKRKASQPAVNARMTERARTDPVQNLGRILKARLTYAARTMQQKITCGRQLRADRDKIRQRLEMNFQPGMSWANYGEWHIDHTKPLAAFAAQGRDLNEVNTLCNLRPVWGKENMVKSSTFKGRHYRYTTGA